MGEGAKRVRTGTDMVRLVYYRRLIRAECYHGGVGAIRNFMGDKKPILNSPTPDPRGILRPKSVFWQGPQGREISLTLFVAGIMLGVTMKIPSLLYLTAVASVFVFALGSEARTWTRAADQKTIEGDFVKAEGDKVTISMKGKNVTLPISALTKEDQDFITAQMDGGGGKKEDGKKEEAKAGSKEMPAGPTEVVLSGAHLCCSKCEKKMEEAVARYDDIKLEFNKDAGTVTFKGETGQAVEDALFKVYDAGFYGTTDHERLQMKKPGGSKTEYEALDVTGIHVCCGKCEKAVKSALKNVPGIEEDTVEKEKSSFKVSGKKITIADLNKALNDVGLNAKSILPPK